MSSTQPRIGALLESYSAAIREKDIERLMALYSSDIVYYDLVPPLRYSGFDAIRRNFLRWFESWQSPIGVEIRDRTILTSGDTATAFMLHRTSGILKDGRAVDYWVRVTVCAQRSDRGWLIAHEHVSLPVDFASGRAIINLVP